MPLRAGKESIGRNVKEMEATGHSKASSVAAALRTALDRPGKDQSLVTAPNGAIPAGARKPNKDGSYRI